MQPPPVAEQFARLQLLVPHTISGPVPNPVYCMEVIIVPGEEEEEGEEYAKGHGLIWGRVCTN